MTFSYTIPVISLQISHQRKRLAYAKRMKNQFLIDRAESKIKEMEKAIELLTIKSY